MRLERLALILLLSSLLASACSEQGGQSEPAAQAPAETDTGALSTEPEEAAKDAGALPLGTDSAEARELYAEGEYLMDVGRGVQARAKFRSAISADPDFVRAYYGASNTALSFNEFQEVLDAAGEHMEGAPDSSKALIEVNRSFLTNDPAKGEAVAEELVDDYPGSPRAHIVLAGMQSAQNDNEAARDSYNAALSLEGNSAGALIGLATNYLFSEPRDFDQAEQVIRRFNAAYPDEAKGYEFLGDVHRAQGDLEAALTAYERAAELDPSLELALHKQGHINSFLGNINDARVAYDAAIAVAPPESKAGYAVYKGFTWIHAGDVEAAINELVALSDNIAAMGTPEDQVKGTQVFALTSAAQAALEAGMYDRAGEIIQRRNAINMAIAEDVGTEDAERLQTANNLLWNGLLAAYRGDAEGANQSAAEIERLVAEDDNPRKLEPVHWVRGVAALKSGNYETAVEELRGANHANNMYIRYQLAQALEGAGQTEEARTLYQQVADFNFNSVGFALVGRKAREKASEG